MSYFPEIKKWVIPFEALEMARVEMAADGQHGNEGTCLWLGSKVSNEAAISHVVLLRGDGIYKHPLNITIAPELMREVHDHAERLDKILVGQVHSHGPFSGIDLSPTDHRYGVKVPYFLSIVWPDYALRPEIEVEQFGIHVFMPNRGFQRLTVEEIRQQIEITTGSGVEAIAVSL